MTELLVDFITSLDGYAAAEGWPVYWGLEGPENLAWLDRSTERDYPILGFAHARQSDPCAAHC